MENKPKVVCMATERIANFIRTKYEVVLVDTIDELLKDREEMTVIDGDLFDDIDHPKFAAEIAQKMKRRKTPIHILSDITTCQGAIGIGYLEHLGAGHHIIHLDNKAPVDLILRS
jgi:urocanate hydratase